MTAVPVFEQLTATLDYPMVIVTTAANGVRAGCLAGFGSQCSIDPSRWVIWLSKQNHTHRIAANADVLAVHILRERDIDLAHLFGEHSSDDIDKFAQCKWSEGPGGVPVLDGVDYFAGAIVEREGTGDHTLHVLAVLGEGRAERASEPQLGFQQVKDFEPGHDA